VNGPSPTLISRMISFSEILILGILNRFSSIAFISYCSDAFVSFHVIADLVAHLFFDWKLIGIL
jgi:hypothetical protein